MTCEETYQNVAIQFRLFEESIWYTIAMLGIFVAGFLLGWIARRRKK